MRGQGRVWKSGRLSGVGVEVVQELSAASDYGSRLFGGTPGIKSLSVLPSSCCTSGDTGAREKKEGACFQ